MIKTKIRRLSEIFFLYKNWIKVLLGRSRILKVDFLKLRNGLKFYTGNILSVRSILNHTFSKREGYDIFQKIKEGDIVIDIGAFIGDFSIKAASLGAIVYSYEPTKKVYNILRKNIKLNGFESRIKAFNIGVYKKTGKNKLILRENPSVNSMIGGNALNHLSKTIGSQEIELITFKQIMDDNNIKNCDFLKIDTEGTEYDIVMGISKKYLRRIKYISMESTDYAKTWTKNKELVKHLEKNGFKVKKGFEMKYFNESTKKFSNDANQNVMRTYAKNEN